MQEIDTGTVTQIITSPPYNIDINYGNIHKDGKAVLSKGVKYKDDLPEKEYRRLLELCFNECKRVLKPNGSIWLNIKNRYSEGVVTPPFWVLDYFQNMYLKNIIIWNFDWGGSTERRFSPRYEYVFWLTKRVDDYIFNLDSIKVPALNYRPDRFKSQMKNPSDVWYIQMVSGNYPERTGHPAQYPEELIERIVKVGSNENDLILDPFMGSGTTARVAKDLNRKYVGYEVVPEYVKMCEERLKQPPARKKKDSKDIRSLYWYMDNTELSEYVKRNGR
ncbi:MAG: site-specific DNA-methyltransferase [Candidatus Micrarchaeia archaeon]